MGKPGFPIPLPVGGRSLPTAARGRGCGETLFPPHRTRRDEHPVLPGKAQPSHPRPREGGWGNPVSPPPAPGDTGADDGHARAGPRGHSPAVSGAVRSARCSGSGVATRRGIIPQTRLSLSTPPACAKIRAAARRRARDGGIFYIIFFLGLRFLKSQRSGKQADCPRSFAADGRGALPRPRGCSPFSISYALSFLC